MSNLSLCQRTGINGESTSMVWPTLGSRTAKEQNRTMRGTCSSWHGWLAVRCSLPASTGRLRVGTAGAGARHVRLPGQSVDRRDRLWLDGHGVVDRRRARSDRRRVDARLRRRTALRRASVQLHYSPTPRMSNQWRRNCWRWLGTPLNAVMSTRLGGRR